VARIHDILEHDGEVFLVMEYVEGQSLRQRIGQPPALSEFLPIAVQCVEALVAAHQSGIVHRDIKPENIMINTKGLVKICDFGLARHTGWTADTAMLDRTPTVAFRGTPAYMAPEALLNRSPDFRADMFSLGIVFYELLTGTHPFREDNNQVATVDRIIHAGHVPVIQLDAAIPNRISRIIDKMLRKEPDARYASPDVLLEELLLVAKDLPVHSSGRNSNARKRFAVGVLSVAIVLAVVFGLLTLNRDGPSAGGQNRNLVVLPFRALGDGKDTRTYSDGFTETLTARLSQETGPQKLAVTPSSEVRARRVSTADEARKQFGADLILAGTLYQSTSELRFTYSLYEVVNLRQLGTGTIATTNTNPFVLEDEVVDAVKKALGFASGQSEPGNEDRTSVPAAYDLYVQGRGHLQDPADSNRLQIAVQAFESAKNLDPSYATAYASLGEAYWAKYQATKEAVWVPLARES
jgi:serine/threonine protein kinase